MIILGLTGSIGMGKTTAARMLKQMGCAVFDSDAYVHQALSSEGQAFEAVALTFPKAWDKKKHLIDRKKLGEIVFEDALEREKLENILHPLVRHAQTQFIRKQKRMGRKFVVLDIPLLFETGAQNRVDYTIVVSAPDFVQRSRVLSRPNMKKEKFKQILQTQMPDNQKCALADFVVPTGLGKAHSYGVLKNILSELSE